MKPCTGRQRNWIKVINELLLQLNMDSQEVLVEIYSIDLFLDMVDEALRNNEY